MSSSRPRKITPKRSTIAPVFAVLTIAVLASIGAMALRRPNAPPRVSTSPSVSKPAAESTNGVRLYSYEIVNTYPHDSRAFTQGLVWHDGVLYEGTGQRGSSSLRRVALETGQIKKKIDLPPTVFGEGIAIWNDSVVQITWQDHVGYVHDLETFGLRRTFEYEGEGWGLTHDGSRIIMSDGSSTLTFRDPATLREAGKLPVLLNGAPLPRLNELEYINGEIWANVWPTNQIVTIDPASGRVTSVIDLTGLLSPTDRGSVPVDVLNGIAWDAERDRIFVTGKYWPKLYEIKRIAQ